MLDLTGSTTGSVALNDQRPVDIELIFVLQKIKFSF